MSNVDALLIEIKSKLEDMVNSTNRNDANDVKRTLNYLSALSSHIDSINRERNFSLTSEQKSKLKRGQVVWIDFGFNIGKEFGGKHPALILRVTSNYQSLLVLPIDGDTEDENIINKRKKKGYWFEIKYICGMKRMSRWANVHRITEISSIRVDFKNTKNAYIAYDILDEIDCVVEKYQYKAGLRKNVCAKSRKS